METKTIRLLIIGLYVVVIPLLIALFILFFVNLSMRFGSEIDQFANEPIVFQQLTYNPTTGESSYGFVDTHEPLNHGEYTSYVNENEEHVLISNFESTEYKCYGTCNCEQERRSTITLSRSIMLFVAGLTSYIALSHAKRDFEDQCQEFLTGECDTSTSTITSKVEKCQPMFRVDEDEEENSEANLGFDEDDSRVKADDYGGEDETVDGMLENVKAFEKIKELHFECEGRCFPYKKNLNYEEFEVEAKMDIHEDLSEESLNIRMDKFQKMSEEYGCEKLELIDTISIEEEELKVQVGGYAGEDSNREITWLAAKYFILYHLNMYCSLESYQELDYGVSSTNGMCLGYDTLNKPENPTVKCIQKE